MTVVLGAGTVTGCSSEPKHGEEPTGNVGSLSMPLVTTTNGHTYRLGGYFYVSGSTFQFYYLDNESDIRASLAAGDYVAYLSGYWLSRLDENGVYQPVAATLVSSYYQYFTIYNRTTTTISYQFETDGNIVTVGAGNLEVNVDVTEKPPVCSVLGTDCPDGTWCAPTELTGRPLACVATGGVAPGDPCTTPQECAANASCYDFGTGPVCAQLCDADHFGLSCSTGGTCVEEASTYGVCTPDSSSGGEGGAGGAAASG